MAEKSGIAWTRSTFNPWIGCTKVSPGCEHCYASVSTPARTMGIQWGAGQPRHRTSQSNWLKPLAWNTRAQKSGEFWPVFCSSLADVFDNEVDLAWRADLFFLISSTPHLTWLLLTKRIGNAKAMMADALHLNPHANRDGMIWPLPNVWLGATIVNQEEADRDIPKLLAVPAAKRFVSYEPALGPVDWTRIMRYEREGHVDQPGERNGWTYCDNALTGKMAHKAGAWMSGRKLDWIIIGGESDQPGMKARPFDIDWAFSTVRQCKEAGAACFVKQLGSAPTVYGEPLALLDRAGADPAEWPEILRVQEWPTPNAEFTGGPPGPSGGMPGSAPTEGKT